MRILKNFILILCIISFFNFGGIEKIRAMEEEFLPKKQANIAFLGFTKSGKTSLKTALENNFQTMCQSILRFDDCTVKCNFWDVFDSPEVDERFKNIDIVIITVALNDPINYWKKVISRNVLKWQNDILQRNPDAKIILACTNADTIADNDQLNNIKMSIDDFVSADCELGGSIQSVILPTADNEYLTTLMDIIKQNLENTNIELLKDADVNIPMSTGWCYVL